MAVELVLRNGTAAENDAFTGALAEVTPVARRFLIMRLLLVDLVLIFRVVQLVTLIHRLRVLSIIQATQLFKTSLLMDSATLPVSLLRRSTLRLSTLLVLIPPMMFSSIHLVSAQRQLAYPVKSLRRAILRPTHRMIDLRIVLVLSIMQLIKLVVLVGFTLSSTTLRSILDFRKDKELVCRLRKFRVFFQRSYANHQCPMSI